jgi:FkbM family methyltransferase
MKINNAIFDVGANNGLDGLGFALLNPHYNIYAFEANPELISEIKKNKKKIEFFFNLELKNYEIINKAISDFNGTADFHVSQFNLCSSLLRYKFVKTKKKITSEVITLENFCIQNNIDNIIHLHVDTQGSDISVIKGLKSYRKKVHTGVMETIVKKKDILYKGGSSYDQVISLFNQWNFKIIKTEFNNFEKKEINVYFLNNLIHKNKLLKFNRFKKRFINRIIENKTNTKDYFYMKYLKLFRL